MRIDGKEYFPGPVISGGRIFYDKEAGTQVVISEAQQLRMALQLRLLDDSPFQELSSSRRQTLKIDWGTFTPAERLTALTRAWFVRKLDKVEQAHLRSKKKVITGVIKDVCKARRITPADAPTPRKVRAWYRIFVAAGRDIRALVPCHWAKGRRGERYSNWAVETVNRLINEKLVTPTPSSFRQVRMLADLELRREAARRGEKLERGGKEIDCIGEKLISRMLRARDKFGVMVETTNWREAQRRARAIQLGPQGDYINHEWETDHTPLDILVIDEQTLQVVGRPWLTAILDRYSRCIMGFSLSFAPPSWASVMDALRVAVMPKDWVFEGFRKLGNGQSGINNDWECYGKPDRLIMDHGRDFKSLSMEETLNALEIDPDYTKPKKPWLKGKIERWFRTLEEQIIHTIPGTVFSSVDRRKFYKSEKFAVLTIYELNWVVAKWVIDIYHQNPHGKIGRPPAQAWREGLREITPHREVPKNLLVPLTGLIVPRALRDGGIRFKGLRWDSSEFSRARAYLPDCADVQVRIDPLDISVCHLYDEKREEWVEGELIEPVEARGMTLNQWRTICRLRNRKIKEQKLSREEATAQAYKEIGQYVQDRVNERRKGMAPQRFAAFVSSGSAWAKMHDERFDEDHDPPSGHPLEFDDSDKRGLPKRASFKEPRRRTFESDEKQPSAEDYARDQEIQQETAEQAPQDVVVSTNAPERKRKSKPRDTSSDPQSTLEATPSSKPEASNGSPGMAPPASAPPIKSDGDDDDDDDDITPLGYGRD
ncbi:putative transposase [Bradyrhizobium japonicum]